AEHAGDVAEGVVAATALLQRAGRLALEVEEVEVAVGDEGLAEVVVAVDADAAGAAGGGGAEGVEGGERAAPVGGGGVGAGGVGVCGAAGGGGGAGWGVAEGVEGGESAAPVGVRGEVAVGVGVRGQHRARPLHLGAHAAGEGGVVLGRGRLGPEARRLGGGEG